jgi:uncharacterized protein (DUF433 family)
MTAEQIVNEYPSLEIDDVRQALQYAAALTTLQSDSWLCHTSTPASAY